MQNQEIIEITFTQHFHSIFSLWLIICGMYGEKDMIAAVYLSVMAALLTYAILPTRLRWILAHTFPFNHPKLVLFAAVIHNCTNILVELIRDQRIEREQALLRCM